MLEDVEGHLIQSHDYDTSCDIHYSHKITNHIALNNASDVSVLHETKLVNYLHNRQRTQRPFSCNVS